VVVDGQRALNLADSNFLGLRGTAEQQVFCAALL
jgi:hypothetical protein